MRTLTDGRGHVVPGESAKIKNGYEPPVASIVMTMGMYGNAWQRHGNDGLWHSTSGGVRRWSQMLRMRSLVLVYEAAEREPQAPADGSDLDIACLGCGYRFETQERVNYHLRNQCRGPQG